MRKRDGHFCQFLHTDPISTSVAEHRGPAMCAAFAASAHGSEVGESGFTWHDVSLLFCAWIVTKKKISVATIALKYWFPTQSINGAAVG